MMETDFSWLHEVLEALPGQVPDDIIDTDTGLTVDTDAYAWNAARV